MLKSVEPVFWLVRVQTHKMLYLNVHIHSINIGVGMVVDIVFNFP